jgi:signal transduction histidine kinase
VNLGEQASSVLKLLSGRCEHAGVIVDTNYSPAAGLALADPGRIRQVILNLALNALDAMPYGGRLSIAVMPAPTISASAMPASAAPAVRLEMTDTGPGVRAAEGVDIFEPFITTKPQGTGLGLYICRRIIESLGGQLGYRDCLQGVTFWFELPAANNHN